MAPPTRWAKRSLDLVAALAGIVALAVLLPVVAVLIKVFSSGPVLVRECCVGIQRREGDDGRGGRRLHDVHGRLLPLWRFRVHAPGDPATAPRLTPVGRVLRATGLEMLPWSWAVLTGRLSLVGPRPLPASFADRVYRAWPAGRRRLLHVKPGLVGGVVREREATFAGCLVERLLFDLAYRERLDRCGPLSAVGHDLSILFGVFGRRPRQRLPGWETVSFDLPASFCQVDLDPQGLVERAPPFVAPQVEAREGRLAVSWRVPRRRSLGTAAPPAAILQELGDGAATGVAVCRLAPGPDRGEDALQVEMPGGLQEVAHVGEALQPLWDALAARVAEDECAGRMTLLLTALLAQVGAEGDGRGRLRLTVQVRARELRLEAVAVPGPHPETSRPVGGLPLARLPGPRGLGARRGG